MSSLKHTEELSDEELKQLYFKLRAITELAKPWEFPKTFGIKIKIKG